MLQNLAKRLFGSSNDRFVKTLHSTVDAITALEPDVEGISDDELKARTDWLRGRIANGESLDDLLPDAFATVREAAKRTLGQRHFDVQMMGGTVLHRGMISEMKTGEGKNPGRHACGVFERARRAGRARGHGERLSGGP